jgi:hypothetical protein
VSEIGRELSEAWQDAFARGWPITREVIMDWYDDEDFADWYLKTYPDGNKNISDAKGEYPG